MRKIVLATAIGLLSAAGPASTAPGCNSPFCVAPSGGGTGSNAWETQAFVGFQWSFGSTAPDLVLGVRRTETTTSNEVYGGKLDLILPLNIDFTLPTVRLLGVAGNRDVQGEAGVGYSFLATTPLLAVGAQFQYVNTGFNYLFSQGFRPYIGLNSLRRPEAASRGGAVFCPSGYTLTDAPPSAAAASVVNGKTCQAPPT